VQAIQSPDHHTVALPAPDVAKQSLVLRARPSRVVRTAIVVHVHLGDEPAAATCFVATVGFLSLDAEALARRVV